MDRKKSQQFNFAFEAAPVMFLTQTSQFMKFLEKDGLTFLKFWWDHVGSQLPNEMLRPFDGMHFKITPVDKDTQIVLITLPAPREDGEMYYLGMIARPERRFAWVRIPNVRALGLVRRPKPDFPNGTEIGDLTPRAIFVPKGAGPEPDEDKFMQIVTRLSQKQSSAAGSRPKIGPY